MSSDNTNIMDYSHLCTNFYHRYFDELSRIEKGGYGTVYKVKHKLDGKIYAIKKVKFPVTCEADKERVLNEAKSLAKLRPEYVVSYHNSWLGNDNHLYIQMEYCPQSLRKVLDDKRLAFGRQFKDVAMNAHEYYISCEIFRELLECVQYLHELTPQIIHRDLKPENVLIVYKTDANNHHQKRFIKIADFGLATIHYSTLYNHTKDRGTITYQAPEVQTGNYGHKCDIYSLGLIGGELFDLDLSVKSYNNHVSNHVLNTRIVCLYRILQSMLSYPVWEERPECWQVLAKYYEQSVNCVTNLTFATHWSIDKQLIKANNDELNKVLQSLKSNNNAFFQKFFTCKINDKCVYNYTSKREERSQSNFSIDVTLSHKLHDNESDRTDQLWTRVMSSSAAGGDKPTVSKGNASKLRAKFESMAQNEEMVVKRRADEERDRRLEREKQELKAERARQQVVTKATVNIESDAENQRPDFGKTIIPSNNSGSPTGLTAKAHYNYNAADLGDISLNCNEGWWRSRCGDKVGQFPTNYVQLNHMLKSDIIDKYNDIEIASISDNSLAIDTKYKSIDNKVDINCMKLFHVFDDNNGFNVLFVTNDDMVYGMGSNYWGGLGLGHDNPVDKLHIIPELCHKNIREFICGGDFVLSINDNNCIHGWGRNDYAQLARSPTDDYIKPVVISLPNNPMGGEQPLVNKHRLMGGEQALATDMTSQFSYR